MNFSFYPLFLITKIINESSYRLLRLSPLLQTGNEITFWENVYLFYQNNNLPADAASLQDPWCEPEPG